ncbi:MAG: protein adenylyltransferase SelO family protein, partial [Halofilum sp. (in: g-proteobacteria)]
FNDPSSFDPWAAHWRERLAAESATDAERRQAMRAVNPAYIPRNHRIQQAIDAATQEDLRPLEELLQVLSSPYEDHPELAEYAHPPQPGEEIRQTFCGT